MTPFRNAEPLVGRDPALGELESLIAEATARDEVSVVRIIGPPGIGKTAFLRTATARYSRGSTAFLTAVPAYAVQPGICARLLAASLADGRRGQHQRPLESASVICVDDLQWVDEVSIRTIGEVIRTSEKLELVLFADRRDDAPGLIPHQTISLESLSDESAARLVRLRFPAVSPQTVDAIVRAAAGLPFSLAMLVEQAAHDGSQTQHGGKHFAAVTIALRLARSQPEARSALRLASLVEGAVDLRAIAHASGVSLTHAAELFSGFGDLVVVKNAAVTFRHALLREAVASTVEEPVGAHRRMLSGYLSLEPAIDRSFAILHCAIACGDSQTAAAYASSIGRQAAAAGASATALRYFEIAIRHAPTPLPWEYAVDYATVLQHLPRSPEAASFLRTQLRDAIERRDGERAANLVTSFSSVTLTLERESEFRAVCDRIAAIPDLTAHAARRLRTARLVSLAFSGRFEAYRRLADEGEPSPADHRIAAFVSALEGDAESAQVSFETYQAGLRSTQALQEPADIVLQAAIALHRYGNAAIADLADVPDAADRGELYQGVAHLRVAARINDGRWDAARELAERQPLWDSAYEEPFPMLDARLELAALGRRVPLEPTRTIRTIRAMIARGQVRHAVSPARWYLLVVERSDAPADDHLSAFVAETLAVAPIPYLVTASPLALAFLQRRFGKAACLRALDHWPQFGSRWWRAHGMLVRALLSADRQSLREARDEFERLGAPALAMIAGVELTVPRATDAARARASGMRRTRRLQLRISLLAKKTSFSLWRKTSQTVRSQLVSASANARSRSSYKRLSQAGRTLSQWTCAVRLQTRPYMNSNVAGLGSLVTHLTASR